MPDQPPPSANPLAKPVKLRESCDACLIAKVKCSKERPLCKRCLTNGHNCNYSPSSKTGRRNHKNDPPKPAPPTTHEQISISTQTGSPLQSKAAHESAQTFFQAVKHADLLDGTKDLFDGGSHLMVPSSSHHSSKDMAIEGARIHTNNHSHSSIQDNPFSPQDFLDPFLPIFDPEKGFDFSTAPISPTVSAGHVTIGRSTPNPTNGFRFEPKTPFELSPYPCTKTSDFGARSSDSSSPSDQLQQIGPSCDCFAACVVVLQTLHKHSCLLSAAQQGSGPSPSFDVVLNTNKEAIDNCAAILGCIKCVSECGKSVVIMMLATVIGKVISLYRVACFLMFGSSNSMQSNAQLAFGAYKLTGENRQLLEIEILLLDLRRVANVLAAYTERFCNGQKDDEASVYETLKLYLESNLRNVVQYLNAQKDNVIKRCHESA